LNRVRALAFCLSVIARAERERMPLQSVLMRDEMRFGGEMAQMADAARYARREG
jgi:hypothetical protein